jgi:hypothetical protein
MDTRERATHHSAPWMRAEVVVTTKTPHPVFETSGEVIQPFRMCVADTHRPEAKSGINHPAALERAKSSEMARLAKEWMPNVVRMKSYGFARL